MQHYDGLRCSNVLADADVVGQGGLLAAFRHVNHSYVRVVELIKHIRLAEVQPLKTDLLKVNSLVNSETMPPSPKIMLYILSDSNRFLYIAELSRQLHRGTLT